MKVRLFLILNFLIFKLAFAGDGIINIPVNTEQKNWDIAYFFSELINKTLPTFVTAISILTIVWVGFKFVKATLSGDSNAIAEAKKDVYYVGGGIALLLIGITVYNVFFEVYKAG